MTRSGADKLVKREATFPAPVTVLTGRTRVWDRDAVENWARKVPVGSRRGMPSTISS